MSLPASAVALQTANLGAMSVQVAEIAGDLWFYAPSLATTLEYRDAPNMLRGVPDKEKGTHLVSTPGGVQDATFLNEPGFYRVVFRSRSALAEPFKEWVFHDVLPSIRRTGQYRVIEEAKRLGHSMDFTDDQWDWLKERPSHVDLIPLALAGYNSVQITRMLGYTTVSGITVRKQIERLKALGFLPPEIEPRAKQLERRIKRTMATQVLR